MNATTKISAVRLLKNLMADIEEKLSNNGEEANIATEVIEASKVIKQLENICSNNIFSINSQLSHILIFLFFFFFKHSIKWLNFFTV